MAQDFQTLIDRLGEASLEAKQLVSELHGATKDARQAIRELQQARIEHQLWIKGVMAEELGEMVKAEIASVNNTVINTKKEIEEKLFQTFEDLSNTLIYGNKQGRGPSIFEQLTAKYGVLLDG